MNRTPKGKWTRRTSALAHAAKARKRLQSPPDPELIKVPANTFLGVLQWTDAGGEVRRWVVRQGPRANNLRITAKGKQVVTGWDHLLNTLRKKLSVPRRILR